MILCCWFLFTFWPLLLNSMTNYNFQNLIEMRLWLDFMHIVISFHLKIIIIIIKGPSQKKQPKKKKKNFHPSIDEEKNCINWFLNLQSHVMYLSSHMKSNSWTLNVTTTTIDYKLNLECHHYHHRLQTDHKNWVWLNMHITDSPMLEIVWV